MMTSEVSHIKLKKKKELSLSSRVSHIAMQTEDWYIVRGAESTGMFRMPAESKSSILVINRQIIVDKGSMQTETDSRMHSVWTEQGRR